MLIMHQHGVSSIAVTDPEGLLLSVSCLHFNALCAITELFCQAVSVTDIGRLVGTSQDRSVFNVNLSQFISLIKVR